MVRAEVPKELQWRVDNKLPVTLLSGFLGSGKTTLLKRILTESADAEGKGKRVAVIVNDMSSLNIDASLVARADASLSQQQERLVQLQNGCICCTLREDLRDELQRLAAVTEPRPFDYVVIESTGVAEPMQVAETFTFGELVQDTEDSNDMTDTEEHEGAPLSDVCRLDTCVTVVDASRFDRLMDMTTPANKDDENDSVAALLTQQVEFADVLLLNKTDLVDERQVERIGAIVKHLNPSAKVIPTCRSNVELHEVLDTGLFSLEAAAQRPGWLQEIRGTHTPETVEYGITSFIYKRRKPFHPRRLADALFLDKEQRRDIEENGDSHELLPEPVRLKKVLRSKGFAWLAWPNDAVVEWASAGASWELTVGGAWFSASSQDEWPLPEDEEQAQSVREEILADFADTLDGDRRQEIVFIGQHLDQQAVEAELDALLLTDDEMKQREEALQKLAEVRAAAESEDNSDALEQAMMELEGAYAMEGYPFSNAEAVYDDNDEEEEEDDEEDGEAGEQQTSDGVADEVTISGEEAMQRMQESLL